MSKLTASLILTAYFFFTASTTHAETDSNSQTIIEIADITIRMTNNNPYAEFRPCGGCMSRLLALTPTAQIYVKDIKINTDLLVDGQEMQGTVFIQKKPIEQIRKIVAN